MGVKHGCSPKGKNSDLGAEENISTKEKGSNKRLKKTA
jgi:hypothetical protein